MNQEKNLADVVQTVFDALQDKIDAKGPIAKSNLQMYVNMLRDAFVADLATPHAQDVQRDASRYTGWRSLLYAQNIAIDEATLILKVTGRAQALRNSTQALTQLSQQRRKASNDSTREPRNV